MMNTPFVFLVERKNQFAHRKVCFVPGKALSVSVDLSFVKALVADSVSESSFSEGHVKGTCAFGLLFGYKDERNFCAVLVSDFDFACVFRMNDGELSFLSEWKKISCRKKHKIQIKNGKMKIDGKLFCEGVEIGEIHLACQNYIVHEKVSAKFSFPLGCTFLSKEEFGSIQTIFPSKTKTCTSQVNPVTDEEDENAWLSYQKARESFIAGDLSAAMAEIFTAAASLSENLAVLELYAFIQLSVSTEEYERAVRLIESNIKHAPFVQEYRDEAKSLLSRLKDASEDKNDFKSSCLKFSMDNRAIFPLEEPLVPML